MHTVKWRFSAHCEVIAGESRRWVWAVSRPCIGSVELCVCVCVCVHVCVCVCGGSIPVLITHSSQPGKAQAWSLVFWRSSRSLYAGDVTQYLTGYSHTHTHTYPRGGGLDASPQSVRTSLQWTHPCDTWYHSPCVWNEVTVWTKWGQGLAYIGECTHHACPHSMSVPGCRGHRAVWKLFTTTHTHTNTHHIILTLRVYVLIS